MFSDSANSVSADTARRQAPSALAGAESWRPRASRAPRGAQHWKIVLTWVGIAVTLVASAMLARDLAGIMGQYLRAGALESVAEQVVFALIVYFLIYGNLVFLATRIGYLRRHADHCAVPRSELEQIYDLRRPPSLTVLVPSYKEEEHTVWQSLLSAALMEYPGQRIVLLIDDPPDAKNGAAAQLELMRSLPARVEAVLAPMAGKFDRALKDFEYRSVQGPIEPGRETERLAVLYREAACWLEEFANASRLRDHTDALFAEKILLLPAKAHHRRSAELLRHARRKGAWHLSQYEIRREYWRLASLFDARLTSFERKKYADLSHRANKAMNLNSYIALLGRNLREVRCADGLHLEDCEASQADLNLPRADYLITLDADSLLLHDYALRLIHVMEAPENQRIAVAQTPYSAVPGTPCMLERIAGATTDIQHIIHQGFTWGDATYWVGANALLRREALDDIRVLEEERGHLVAKYIQDRTVIEDTESSIDLILKNWRLYNYPARLAYSATPADFGSLVVQRRRWANGGLLILPKLLRYLGRAPYRAKKLAEGWMRIHYLTSLAGVGAGTLILLFYPFEASLRSWWLPVSAVPYFLLYGRELVASGYGWADLPRVYALNLLLIPVNLGGVCKSLHQALTGRRTNFGRTPKIAARTAAPAFYVAAPLAILAISSVRGTLDLVHHLWAHAGWVLCNAALLGYAFSRFVGLSEAIEDLRLRTLMRQARAFISKISAFIGTSRDRRSSQREKMPDAETAEGST